MSKHTDNNSQVSLLRAGESQEQLMLVVPMQLAWRDAWEGTWHLCSEEDQVSRLLEWFQRLSVTAARSQCGTLTGLVSQQMMSSLRFFFKLVYSSLCQFISLLPTIQSTCACGCLLQTWWLPQICEYTYYMYTHTDIHTRCLMEDGINFLNQQHIPKSAFMSVN